MTKSNLDNFRARLATHYTPGNVIFVDYWNSFDRVLSFAPETDAQTWSVIVEKVELIDGKWTAIGSPRVHYTPMTPRDRVEVGA